MIGPLAGPSLEANLHFGDTSIYGARARALDLTIRSEALGSGAELAIGATGRDIGYGRRSIPRGTASGAWRDGRPAGKKPKGEKEEENDEDPPSDTRRR